MFGDGDGRIPVIAVPGTNGKTTTTRLIAHAVGLTGLHTGMTTAEGVYIDGMLADEGDCTGYHSARMLLSAPEVDFAVLETARGGILKRGLAFDRCDVSVVLNVTADHLGMDGIDTLHDLARVKQVVANAASRAVVLNAEDPLCVAMAAQLRSGVELLYFSMDAENPELLRHMEQGGRAVYLQDNMAILRADQRPASGRHRDVGPGAGEEGGMIVASGTPSDLADSPARRTAPYLRRALTPPGVSASKRSPGRKAAATKAMED